MENRQARPLIVGVVALVAVSLSQLAWAELAPRLITDPKPAGLLVSLDTPQSESGSLQLTVKNHSTVLLIVDGTRSSFTTPDGQLHQLSAGISGDFTAPLLPGGAVSGVLSGLGALQAGNQLKVRLVWTLGAVVGSATWVWEMEGAPATTPETPSQAASPPTQGNAEVSQPATTGSAGSDYLIGLTAIVAGLVLLVVLGWGLWSLLS
jgi:hypothetical protein